MSWARATAVLAFYGGGLSSPRYAIPASMSSFQTSAWSTTSTPSFAALSVLLAPTFSPVISRSVAADTDLHALRWHVFVWDLWFLVWGVALFVAARRAGTNFGH